MTLEQYNKVKIGNIIEFEKNNTKHTGTVVNIDNDKLKIQTDTFYYYIHPNEMLIYFKIIE